MDRPSIQLNIHAEKGERKPGEKITQRPQKKRTESHGTQEKEETYYRKRGRRYEEYNMQARHGRLLPHRHPATAIHYEVLLTTHCAPYSAIVCGSEVTTRNTIHHQESSKVFSFKNILFHTDMPCLATPSLPYLNGPYFSCPLHHSHPSSQ